MESPELTFAALDAKIEALPEFPPKTLPFPRKGRWGFPIAAAGTLFSLLCIAVLLRRSGDSDQEWRPAQDPARCGQSARPQAW